MGKGVGYGDGIGGCLVGSGIGCVMVLVDGLEWKASWVVGSRSSRSGG